MNNTYRVYQKMKKLFGKTIFNIFSILNTISFISFICWNSASFGNSLSSEYIRTAMQDILVLMIAYPETITGVEYNNNKIYLIMKSGNKILYDDMEAKTFKDKLLNADVQDMLEQIYPTDQPKITPVENFVPGRIRCYDFFTKFMVKAKRLLKNN